MTPELCETTAGSLALFASHHHHHRLLRVSVALQLHALTETRNVS